MSEKVTIEYKNWYGASELINLPGLPGTVRCIIDKSIREEWVSRRRTTQGGGNEYYINSLPDETRQYLISLVSMSDRAQYSVNGCSYNMM